jgi:hypothetical protein
MEHEQGVAHLVEHITFLGSKQREGLLGTGARSNAYTDFHHTVFHVHSPDINTTTSEPIPMLPQVRGVEGSITIIPPPCGLVTCWCLAPRVTHG